MRHLLPFVLLFSLHVHAQEILPDLSQLHRIDPTTVLLSPEYTFQDREMVNETGPNPRLVVRTPYKIQKAKEFGESYLELLGLDPGKNLVPNLNEFKAGYYLEIPNEGQYYVDSEPVCIEVNHTPRNIFGVAQVAPGIFSTAQKIGLVPYVQPAAERSGMGHVHVGGRSLKDNPFFANPLLLRNVMVYYHQHPSLLWGFAEAYDIGEDSNIESFHTGRRPETFARAVTQFDQWWEKATTAERSNGMAQFIKFLQQSDRSLIAHYRFINLEHVAKLGNTVPTGEETGKLTVEFRNFRPPRSAAHTLASLSLLLHVFEHLSEPNRLEPLRKVLPEEYDRFFAASKVEADWQDVSKELGLDNPLLDEMIAEYATAVHRKSYRISGIRGAKLSAAYSRKEDKGTKFELLVPAKALPEGFGIQIKGQSISLEKIKIKNRFYWLGVLDTKAKGPSFTPEELRSGKLKIEAVRVLPRCDGVLDRAAS